jgi:hypothetical protein
VAAVDRTPALGTRVDLLTLDAMVQVHLPLINDEICMLTKSEGPYVATILPLLCAVKVEKPWRFSAPAEKLASPKFL